jgi:hypothetical protein
MSRAIRRSPRIIHPFSILNDDISFSIFTRLSTFCDPLATLTILEAKHLVPRKRTLGPSIYHVHQGSPLPGFKTKQSAEWSILPASLRSHVPRPVKARFLLCPPPHLIWSRSSSESLAYKGATASQTRSRPAHDWIYHGNNETERHVVILAAKVPLHRLINGLFKDVAHRQETVARAARRS